jgi:hypothetical protein
MGGMLMVLSLDITLLPTKGTNAAYLADSRGFMDWLLSIEHWILMNELRTLVKVSSRTFAHGMVICSRE